MMSRYYIKQKVFSWNDQFTVKDENGKNIYSVEGALFSFGKKLTVYDVEEVEVLYIEQEIWNFLPTYTLSVQGQEVAQIKKELSFLKPKYTINGPGWHVEGSVWQHRYQMIEGTKVMAEVEKEWFTWGDSYALTVHDEEAALLALGIMIVIDCVIASQESS